jgi:hypothetical protein
LEFGGFGAINANVRILNIDTETNPTHIPFLRETLHQTLHIQKNKWKEVYRLF